MVGGGRERGRGGGRNEGVRKEGGDGREGKKEGGRKRREEKDGEMRGEESTCKSSTIQARSQGGFEGVQTNPLVA